MYYYVLGGIMENISIDICKKEIKKNIEDIERSYEVPFSIIGKLREYQQSEDKYSLEIENESAKEKTLIYGLNVFLQNIKIPIYEFLEDRKNVNQNLIEIIEKLEDFLFRIDFQFNKYLNSKKFEAIYEKKKNEMDSEQILEYTNLKEKIKKIITDLILISTLFGVEKNLKKRFENEDKKMLEVMGIFLSIFSVVGISASSILNLQNNHISVLLMINGFVLITMTGLFYLIKFEKEKFIISKNWGFLIPLMIGLIMIVFGGIINIPSETGKEKEIELLKKQIEKLDDKIELEKRLNLESKIINLENKTK